MLWREVRVALMLGVVLAIANFLIMAFITVKNTQVALVVSMTMFVTVLIAKTIGCSLPLLAKLIHLDPALMASPIITTIVDAASLLVLFSIATKAFAIA